MRFEDLLTRSARLVWQRPWLWLLALLAGETAGGGTGGGSGSTSFPAPSSRTGAGGTSSSVSAPDLGWLPGWFNDRLGLFLDLALVLLLLGVLFFLLSCLAEGALVGTVGRLDAGEPVSFGESWRIGARAFWRVLGFRLVGALLTLFAVFVLLIPPLAGAVAGGSGGLVKGLLLDLPLLVTAVFWISFVTALALLGLRACVLEGRGPIASYGAAWDLLRRRFGRVALTWLILLAVGIGVGIAIQVLLTVVWLPLAGPVTDALARGRWANALSAGLVAAAVLLPVSLALSSAAGAYFSTAWTVAYRRFDSDGEIAEPPPLAA